ncbi:branched-chain amino acid ABC transporter permease [Patescibacteria group bacterium]|nr:MAG: branched-chain amino acid ABC transporter permease [Patescibacteria group bacterium]
MEAAAQVIINGIIAAGMYAIMAMAFHLVYGVGRYFHLALGAFALVGGYAMLWCLRASWPIWIAMIVSILVAGMVGWACDRSVFRPLRARRASPLVSIVASLGLLIFLQAILALSFSVEFRSYPVTLFEGSLEMGGGVITWTQLTIVVSAVACFAALRLFLTRTKYGCAVRAVSDDVEVATMIGIDVERVMGLVAFLAACLSGLAGILTGFDLGLQPTMGLALILKGAVAGVIGGLGTLNGALLGAAFLGVLENVGIWFIASQWKDTITYGALIVFLVARPRGILSKR